MIINYKKEKGFTHTPTSASLPRVFKKIYTINFSSSKKPSPNNPLMKQQKTTLKLVSGFTLIETLVAISILMIAIASPINLAQKSLSSAVLSRDQMTASFLAQDGLEAVKNLRDEIAIRSDSTDWLLPSFDKCICDNISKQCDLDLPVATYCNIDTTINNLRDANSIIGSDNALLVNPLRIATNNGVFMKYDLSSAPESKFYRYINIMISPGNSDEAVVQVRVSWLSGAGIQTIDIKDFIYNYSPFL